MSFADLSTVQRCSLPKETFRWANLTCDLARSTSSCGTFVYLINYLTYFFCFYKLPHISIFGWISGFLLLVYFNLLYMLTKYFFVPNLITLIEFAPMTKFGFSFLFFGPSFFLSYFNSVWAMCDPRGDILSPMSFAKIMGDVMRNFVIGIMAISKQGYRSEGVTLWSCMTFILVGMGYLHIVTKKSYHVHTADPDLYLIKFRVMVFLYTFVMVLLVIYVVSHATFKRSLPKDNTKSYTFLDMDSGDEILGKYQKQRVFSKRQLWVKAVNGFQNMKDSHVVYSVLMLPFYFIVSNFFPVITKDRFLVGWNKYVCFLCLIVLPFLCLSNGFTAASWAILLKTCWALSIVTFITTHPLRRPDNVCIFALLGIIVSSVSMNILSHEIENIAWQYISLQFDVMPDITALMYFGMGEIFSEAVIVRCLQGKKMFDAAFGVVMSMVTYPIFLAFPLLYYQGCYNPRCSIIVTASTDTGVQFIFLIVTMSLLHISMSGYEFRVSLFLYVSTLTVIYVTIQWMIHFNWILPIATLYNKTTHV